jgi:three-Cys-motif partner protein
VWRSRHVRPSPPREGVRGTRRAAGGTVARGAEHPLHPRRHPQCVGEWAEDKKHHILRTYIDATREVRAKYLPENGGGGGAAFIDLSSGPGRARVREDSHLVDGSPLIAAKHAAAPFSKLIFCDLDPENVGALQARTRSDARVKILHGDCNIIVEAIAAEIPEYGLNLALYDPYALSAMDFAAIKTIASVGKRMDLLINFPTDDMKRNLAKRQTHESTKARMGKALGEAVTASRPKDVPREIETLRKNLAAVGYTGKDVRSVAVENGVGVIMYHLVYASKDPLGDKIWQRITRPKQRELALPT